MLTKNLDLSALRTFALAADLGGFGKAARKLHRTPGAVSLQLKTLEERVGVALFTRLGRQQQLTAPGEVLLAYARQLLQTNDEALLAIKGAAASGEVRFGMPQDLADGWLPHTLAQFARAFPAVRIQIRVGRSVELMQALADGEIDLGLMFGAVDERSPALATRLAVRWFGSPGVRLPPGEAVPLLLLNSPCTFRDTAIKALDDAKRSWRVVLVSSSVSAVWAAAEAGLGVTARTAIHVPRALATVESSQGLPTLSDVGLFLRRGSGTVHPVVAHLEGLVRETVEIKTGVR
jgi:DNA-binding transcriptional LysR family regulator